MLTTDITQWTSVGAYEAVRKTARRARTLGLFTGVAGTAAIILAFSLIDPKIEPATLHSYHLTSKPESDALTKAAQILGPGCTDFKGVVTEVKDTDRQVQVLVEPSPACDGGLVTVPIANLKRLTTPSAKGSPPDYLVRLNTAHLGRATLEPLGLPRRSSTSRPLAFGV